MLIWCRFAESRIEIYNGIVDADAAAAVAAIFILI